MIWLWVGVWFAIGLSLLLYPEGYARLGGHGKSHVNTHPIPGYLSYGAHVRLCGAFLVLMCLFIAWVITSQ